jgi:putative ABC transport system permease protein
MNPLDYVGLAFRAIRANPLRAVLTTLGVVIGVSSVVALVSLGEGAGTQISSQIKGLGSGLIIISPQDPPNGRATDGPPQLYPDDAEQLRDGLKGIQVIPEQSGKVPIRLGSKTSIATVIGTWSNYATARGLKLSRGEFLSPKSDKSDTANVVLGADIADRLFGRLNPIGRSVLIKENRYQVIGVAAALGYQGFSNVDQFVYVPFLATQTQLLGSDTVNHIYVQSPNESEIPALSKEITAIVVEAHGVNPDPSDHDFMVRSQSALLATANGTLGVITTLLSSIAAISLLVGGIGIMNIMLVSVTERTREIGIRMALGAVPSEIVAQFITEAIMLSSLGGLLGVLGGIGAARVISATAGWSTVVSPLVVLVAFGFSFVVGVFFGWYPAFQASRMDPIQALRYE